MKCGEIQAVVQLAVAINLGIYAIKDLSVPYLLRQRAQLNDLRALLNEKLDNLTKMDHSSVGKERKDEFECINRRISSVYRKSTHTWDLLESYNLGTVSAASICFFMSIYCLFHTAYFYNEQAPYWLIYATYISYFSVTVPTSINIWCRYRGWKLIREQNMIRNDISKL